jgi:hypothetical protein
VVEGPDDEFYFLLKLHTVCKTTSIRIPPNYEFVFQVEEGLMGEAGDVVCSGHSQLLQSGVVEPEDVG